MTKHCQTCYRIIQDTEGLVCMVCSKDYKQHPILFRGKDDDPTTLHEVIGQGCGAVSACWENISGAGVFESSRASEIVEEMLAWINAHYNEITVCPND